QLNQLGNTLQSSASRDEVFQTLPDGLARLLPGTSGLLSVLNSSRSYAATVAEWGITSSELDGASISVPLVAHGEAMGVLVIRDARSVSGTLETDIQRARRQQLGAAVAEQIALTIANLDLRDALRAQATHDPLTGLPNRRHMQEFLEREIHRARRQRRP